MGISIWQLLIILAIVLLLFGSKKLKNLGFTLLDPMEWYLDQLPKNELSSQSTE